MVTSAPSLLCYPLFLYIFYMPLPSKAVTAFYRVAALHTALCTPLLSLLQLLFIVHQHRHTLPSEHMQSEPYQQTAGNSPVMLSGSCGRPHLRCCSSELLGENDRSKRFNESLFFFDEKN